MDPQETSAIDNICTDYDIGETMRIFLNTRPCSDDLEEAFVEYDVPPTAQSQLREILSGGPT